MIIYTTGDLLQSKTQALVNTVNCEGYMGKGIAYQFKLKYPQTNSDYIKACKNHDLKIGQIHYFYERDKIIINFPTKDKWREKSKMEYIEKGLDSLIYTIKKLSIKSIAIPPLGSGNGGLIWDEVKKMIENKLMDISNHIEIVIYEPSIGYVSKPYVEPKLNVSALVLMMIKHNLVKFNKLRLQKAAYFTNIFLDDSYFNFKRHKYGPYDHSIEIISKGIKEFQKFYSITDSDEAYQILYNKLVSENVDKKLRIMKNPLEKACIFINSLSKDSDVECCATIAYLLEESTSLTKNEIVNNFINWSSDKAERFKLDDIDQGINILLDMNIIEEGLLGYSLINNKRSRN